MRCARVSYLKRQGQFPGLRERRLGHLELPYMGRALRTKDPVRYLLAVSFDKNRQLRRRLGYHAIANYKSSRNRTNGRVLKLHLHLQLLPDGPDSMFIRHCPLAAQNLHAFATFCKLNRFAQFQTRKFVFVQLESGQPESKRPMIAVAPSEFMG